MFTITADPTFTHPVKAQVPVDGGHRVDEFKATFRVLPVEAMAAFDLSTEPGTRDFLVRTIVYLEELVDDRAEAVPYSDAVRDQVIGLPYARIALVRAYVEGVTKGRTGN